MSVVVLQRSQLSSDPSPLIHQITGHSIRISRPFSTSYRNTIWIIGRTGHSASCSNQICSESFPSRRVKMCADCLTNQHQNYPLAINHQLQCIQFSRGLVVMHFHKLFIMGCKSKSESIIDMIISSNVNWNVFCSPSHILLTHSRLPREKNGNREIRGVFAYPAAL